MGFLIALLSYHPSRFLSGELWTAWTVILWQLWRAMVGAWSGSFLTSCVVGWAGHDVPEKHDNPSYFLLSNSHHGISINFMLWYISFWHMYLVYLPTFFQAFYLVYLRRCFVVAYPVIAVKVQRGTLWSEACGGGRRGTRWSWACCSARHCDLELAVEGWGWLWSRGWNTAI